MRGVCNLIGKNDFFDAINDAIRLSMIKNSKVLCYGLGVTDPKNVFGTTANLEMFVEIVCSIYPAQKMQ